MSLGELALLLTRYNTGENMPGKHSSDCPDGWGPNKLAEGNRVGEMAPLIAGYGWMT